MYEQIMISKMLDMRDTSMLSEQGLHPEMFLNTQAELNFILAHENKYKCAHSVHEKNDGWFDPEEERYQD